MAVQCSFDQQLSADIEILRSRSHQGVFMNIRRTALAVALAATFATPLAAHAANFSVDIDVAPPAPVYERMPARAGYVVTPGYYRYDNDRRQHVWVKGNYQAERHGEHYVASEWSKNEGRYHFNEGRWEHDK